MSTCERLRSEQAFHDRQASARARALRPDDLPFADAAYLDHACWIRPAFAQLGDVRGKRVLDLGCGHGMAAVVLARRGAGDGVRSVAGLSARGPCPRGANRVTARWVLADGHRLPFADGAFDRIWGSAVLHHLDLERTGPELRRVLRPGGVAVFCEPWGENPLLTWARRRLPYPGKQRTADEEPLRRRDLDRLRACFPRLEIAGHQFLAMAARLVGGGRLTARLERWDARLLGRWPGLQWYCRYIVVTLKG